MDPQFRCQNERRARLVEAHPTLNGIEYLEVVDRQAPAGSPRQRTLLVRCLKPLPATLSEENVRIESAPTAEPVRVEWARRAADAAALRSEGRITTAERDFLLALPAPDATLAVRTNSAGDFSTYTLRLVTSPTDPRPPDPFDVRISAIDFSFKVECPSEFDCKAEPACPSPERTSPLIDYLAKDYASFRRLMLDRLSVLMPDWRDRSAADLQVALVELLAYVGDHLSYYQDAVATEAYLGTARRRVSVRRHARLLDYFMHEGCNARVWVHVAVEPGGGADGGVLPAGTELRTRSEDYLVFETMHPITLYSRHNEIAFYTWEDDACCLPQGSTRASLLSRPAPGGPSVGPPLNVQPGDVLIFEETRSPTTGLPADADPTRRHPVRITATGAITDPLTGAEILDVTWHEDDALPFVLCLSARVPVSGGGFVVEAVSVARGNIVLSDQGKTITGDPPQPSIVSVRRYRPSLRHANVTFAEPFDPVAAQDTSATKTAKQDPHRAVPSRLVLSDGSEDWHPVRDLLGSDRFAAEFVTEIERDGRAYLRFGDDVSGKAPSAGRSFAATYRIGNGPAGNVGAEAIRNVVGVPGIISVRNPLPAGGGAAPESMEEVRQFAPHAFRTQQRAVTEADYVEVAERFPGVQRASARFRWTGSWYTVFITVDRVGGQPVREDLEFLSAFRTHVERFRLAGYDIEIADPTYVPLDVSLSVCVAPNYFRSDVKQALLRVFSRFDLPDGRRGFFHPDNFTFGQPVYLSQIYDTALVVEGVASVEVRRLQRYGRTSAGELEAGELVPTGLEVIRLDNDPSMPGNGKIKFDMRGGL